MPRAREHFRVVPTADIEARSDASADHDIYRRSL
jgi:hypothetical protein